MIIDKNAALFMHQLIHNMKQIVHGITMKTTSAEHGQNMFRSCSALVVFMVILSYCGLLYVRISASEKDLPVNHHLIWHLKKNHSRCAFTANQ